MSIPNYRELMMPVLKAVEDGEAHSLKSIRTQLAKDLNLTEEDLLRRVKSGDLLFNNRIAFARLHLLNAGLISDPARGIIQITEKGKQALAENPDKIVVSGSETVDADDSISTCQPDNDLTPEEQIDKAYDKIHADLASELLEEVKKINGYKFEEFVVQLLCKMGYGAEEYGSHVTVASGDGGIDGIIKGDKLGFSTIYMQAKQWTVGSVGRPEVQKLVGAIAGKKGRGLLVTTSKFSSDAEAYAKDNNIILINGEKLADLMIEYNFCVSPKATYEIKKIDIDALSDYLPEDQSED
jgi:restriction system protein